MKKYKTVALLGRQAGLEVLQNVLLTDERIELTCVVTHAQLPTAEGGGERPEYKQYQQLCAAHALPLLTLDRDQAKQLDSYLPTSEIDFIISLSWRYILPKSLLARARCASINLHRGDIDKFPGTQPVRRALEANETRVAITAHHMIEEVDAGPALATVWREVPSLESSAQDRVALTEAVKQSLIPLYSPLLQLALDAVLTDQRFI